jgi:tetratricopeptide (TPR) repeat protein
MTAMTCALVESLQTIPDPRRPGEKLKHPMALEARLLWPARELLGEMLLEVQEPLQALKEFEHSLRVEPNRFNGLFGAARSAQLAGNAEKARSYYAKLVSLSEHSDGARPELTEARMFLAK